MIDTIRDAGESSENPERLEKLRLELAPIMFALARGTRNPRGSGIKFVPEEKRAFSSPFAEYKPMRFFTDKWLTDSADPAKRDHMDPPDMRDLSASRREEIVTSMREAFGVTIAFDEKGLLLDSRGNHISGLHPAGRTGKSGLFDRWRFGVNWAEDTIIERTNDVDGSPVKQVLVGRRKDNGKWAFFAGMVDKGEKEGDAAARELHEEAGLRIQAGELVYQGLSGDPRDSDEELTMTRAYRKKVSKEEGDRLLADIRLDKTEMTDATWLTVTGPDAEATLKNMHAGHGYMLWSLYHQEGAVAAPPPVPEVLSRGEPLNLVKRITLYGPVFTAEQKQAGAIDYRDDLTRVALEAGWPAGAFFNPVTVKILGADGKELRWTPETHIRGESEGLNSWMIIDSISVKKAAHISMMEMGRTLVDAAFNPDQSVALYIEDWEEVAHGLTPADIRARAWANAWKKVLAREIPSVFLATNPKDLQDWTKKEIERHSTAPHEPGDEVAIQYKSNLKNQFVVYGSGGREWQKKMHTRLQGAGYTTIDTWVENFDPEIHLEPELQHKLESKVAVICINNEFVEENGVRRIGGQAATDEIFMNAAIAARTGQKIVVYIAPPDAGISDTERNTRLAAIEHLWLLYERYPGLVIPANSEDDLFEKASELGEAF